MDLFLAWTSVFAVRLLGKTCPKVAALASELGEWALALDRWATLAERLPEGHGQAQAALAAAYAAVRLERPDEAYLFVERARVLAPTDRLVAIEADLREGQALRWLENRTAEAQALTDRAAAAAQQLVAEAGGTDALGDVERRLSSPFLTEGSITSSIRTARSTRSKSA